MCLCVLLRRHTPNQWRACHVVLTGPGGGDGWCIYEAPFRALDQGLRASSSQTERGTGGSRDDGGKDGGKEGRMDGWREVGDGRMEGFRDGERGRVGGVGWGVRETGPPAWREGHRQQGGSESC